jgi:predicted permease
VFSYPLFRDLEALEATAIRFAAHRDFGASVAYGGSTSHAEGLLVSSHYFSALRLAPAAGRLLGPEDNRTPGGHPVAVLSHDYWTNRFGAHPGIVGERVTLNGTPVTIVGVAPAGFFGTTALDRPQVFVPLSMTAHAYGVAVADSRRLTDRGDHWLYVFGRLAPGVDRATLQARLNPPFAGILNGVELPLLRDKMRAAAREAFAQRRLVLEDGSRVRNAARDEINIIVALMFAVTGFVLAIACANVANLLLVRAVDRFGEIALRFSLGASAGRVVRLLLAESLLIGLAASTAALGVAKLTMAVFLTLMPPEDVPMYEMTLNSSLLVFTLVVGLVTSVLFGLFPTLHTVRHATAVTLQSQSHRASGGKSVSRFRAMTATVQVALATALLALAGLFATSLINIGRQEIGIRREGLAAFRVTPSLNGYTPARAEAFFDELDQALRGMPGVTNVSASTVPLLADNNARNFVTVEGFEAGPGPDVPAYYARVGAGYFNTVGIPILKGRDFTVRDTRDRPAVAIVNEAFVRQFRLAERAVGRRMALGREANIELDIEIVGVVADAKYSEVRQPTPPQLCLPYRQSEAGVGGLTFYVRTSSASTTLLGSIPGVVSRLDPNLPIANLRTMDDQIWENTARERVMSTLSAMFAVLATVLAVVGLYAMLAYSVSQRLREIGIRIAMGAQPSDIRKLVALQVTRIGAAGGVIGVVLAFGLSRLGESMFIGVERSSGPIIAAAALLALIAVAAAGVLPARRAERVDPVEILR